MEVISQEQLMKLLDWAYDKAINGLPKCETAQELGDCYLREWKGELEAADSLIRWQNTKAGAIGFADENWWSRGSAGRLTCGTSVRTVCAN